MKNIIKFILFLIYTISIFFIKSYVLLGIIAITNIILTIALRINIKKAIKNILQLLPFILFMAVINIIFGELESAILIGIKLILVCNITFTFSKLLSYIEFGEVIEIMMYPLKIFKINPKEIGLIVTIAIVFIPVIKDKIKEIKISLKSKGLKTGGIHFLKNTNLFFKPFFVSIFQRINELEYSLRAKGYQ